MHSVLLKLGGSGESIRQGFNILPSTSPSISLAVADLEGGDGGLGW